MCTPPCGAQLKGARRPNNRVVIGQATRFVIDQVGWRAAYSTFAAILAGTLVFVLLNVRDRADSLGLQPDGGNGARTRSDGGRGRGGHPAAPPDQVEDKQAGLGCWTVFKLACSTTFFPAFLICSSAMEVGWGALNFHINEVFVEAGLTSRSDTPDRDCLALPRLAWPCLAARCLP